MSKVIQVRGVPDDVHAKLAEAAERAGKSLTAYLAEELALVAARADLVWHNREVILAGQRAIHAKPSSGRGAAAMHTARAEREERLDRATRRRRP
jgi:hypothetical protein